MLGCRQHDHKGPRSVGQYVEDTEGYETIGVGSQWIICFNVVSSASNPALVTYEDLSMQNLSCQFDTRSANHHTPSFTEALKNTTCHSGSSYTYLSLPFSLIWCCGMRSN